MDDDSVVGHFAVGGTLRLSEPNIQDIRLGIKSAPYAFSRQIDEARDGPENSLDERARGRCHRSVVRSLSFGALIVIPHVSAGLRPRL